MVRTDSDILPIRSHVFFFPVPQPLSRGGRERRPSGRVVAQSK